LAARKVSYKTQLEEIRRMRIDMAENCLCNGVKTLICVCSGASNVGQISNKAAMVFGEEGTGRFFCLAGIGGNIARMVDTARDEEMRVVIDGCPTGCGKATLERAGVKADVHVVVTDLGVKKQHNFNFTDEEVSQVVAKVKESLQS
jgi:uncharacterized metal-binding protein